MQTELEKDILGAESFSELMLIMETKGIHVSELCVLDRLFGFLIPEDAVDWTQSDRSDLFKKIMRMIGLDMDLWRRIPAAWIVSHIIRGMDRLDPRRCETKLALLGLTLMCKIAEFRQPGILRSIVDGNGNNLVVQVFERLGVFDTLDAIDSCNCRTTFDPLKFFRDVGLDIFLEIFVFKFGFPADLKLDRKRSLLSILGADGMREMEKSFVSRLTVDNATRS